MTRKDTVHTTQVTNHATFQEPEQVPRVGIRCDRWLDNSGGQQNDQPLTSYSHGVSKRPNVLPAQWGSPLVAELVGHRRRRAGGPTHPRDATSSLRHRARAHSWWAQLGRSRNRHNGDGTAAKFLANVALLAAIRPSAFKHNGNLSLTAPAPTAIENHLSVRVVREPLPQIIVQCPMPQRHDEYVPSHLVLIAQPRAAACGRSPSSARRV
jgi:hypothetical protein